MKPDISVGSVRDNELSVSMVTSVMIEFVGAVSSTSTIFESVPVISSDLDEIATDDVPSLPVKSVNELT